FAKQKSRDCLRTDATELRRQHSERRSIRVTSSSADVMVTTWDRRDFPQRAGRCPKSRFSLTTTFSFFVSQTGSFNAKLCSREKFSFRERIRFAQRLSAYLTSSSV